MANWQHLHGLTLADPHHDTPGRIDCLLGAEVFAAVLLSPISMFQKGNVVTFKE